MKVILLAGGFGTAILEYCQQNDENIPVIRMGIPDRYIEHATRKELLDNLKLNPEGVLECINSLKL